MPVKGAALVVAVVWLCLLFRTNQDRSRLLLVVVVAAGLLLLAILQPLGQVVAPLAAGVVQAAQLAGWVLGPLALLAGVCWAVWRVLRGLWWRWPERSPRGRLGVLAGSVSLGVLVAVIVRAVPLAVGVGLVGREAAVVGLRRVGSVALEAMTAVLTSSRLDLLVPP